MKRHNSGSTLVMVVVMSAVSSILAAALITILLTANTVSQKNVNNQQAYFTARSAVNAMISKLNDNDDTAFREYVASLQDDIDYTSGIGTMSGGGNYTITLRKKGNKLKVTGRGYYPALSDYYRAVGTVSVNLIASGDNPNAAVNPLNNLVYITESQNSSINPSQCFGDIVFSGSMKLSSGSVMEGNVYVGGSLSISNGAHIGKNAYIKGNLDMAGDYIGGDAYCLGNVSFKGESKQIAGTLYYKGFVTTSNNTLPYFAPSSVKKPDLTFEIPLTAAKADTSLPEKVAAEVLANPVMITHSTTLINRSGTLVSCDDYADGNQPVIIDTDGGDIYLLAKRSIILRNRQFYVKGANHLYIYIEGDGTTLTLAGGSPVIRMLDKEVASKIFVIGGPGTSLVLNSAEIAGIVYIPDGNIQIDGGVSNNGMQTGYAVVGSIAAKTARITSNVKLKYMAADLDGTPLSALIGNAQQGGKAWQIESWGK